MSEYVDIMGTSHELPTYVIIDSSETGSLDFTEIKEDNKISMRTTMDGKKALIHYIGNMPPSIAALSTKSGEFTHSEIILEIDSTGSNWINHGSYGPGTPGYVGEE